MKRESSRYRAMPFPARIVKPINKLNSNLPSANELSGPRARKIFVIQQAIHVLQANNSRKTIRRILIFDNHPDSLGLVFGYRANRPVHPSSPQRVNPWELILALMLAMGALIGMFWPILRSSLSRTRK
jgi:hypothetical protein